ncbi:zinc finger MYM-type protein 1-like [Montipora capricornis]|uniref:zinc finger MYM-type protein 1-like n=1 Tax=Montipora capricornis TaxID=246305 RepID=UPI0035F1FB72
MPLRGNWDPSKRDEDGNFSFFVDWKSKYDPELKDHLDHASGNAKYTSPRIHKWSVMADETQDCSTTEQLSLCVRYLSSKNEVCEEFIGFVRLEKLDAHTIADTLLHALQEWGFNMSGLVGQRYDGASVMSSSRNGVQAKVAEKYPNATYVYCRSHVLNLALSSGCKAVRFIQNLFDNVSKLTWFLSGSAKRKEIFLQWLWPPMTVNC